MVLCQGGYEEEGGVQRYSDETTKGMLQFKETHLQYEREYPNNLYYVLYCGGQDWLSEFSARISCEQGVPYEIQLGYVEAQKG
jgi:hypothetical protein